MVGASILITRSGSVMSPSVPSCSWTMIVSAILRAIRSMVRADPMDVPVRGHRWRASASART